MSGEPAAVVIWNHIDMSRRNHMFRGSRREVSAATDVKFSAVKRVMSAWKDIGAVEYVRDGLWRVNFRPPAPDGRRDLWPREAEEALRRLSADGWSTTRIAKHLGYSNSAVCGKRSRMGLEKRSSPIRRRTA
jgi:hypothetical protein